VSKISKNKYSKIIRESKRRIEGRCNHSVIGYERDIGVNVRGGWKVRDAEFFKEKGR